ncbi:MAG: arylsulfatase [Planctomycetales bacterium]|nr:arylsulfatase [Planctomycetales bacterium]
MLALSRFAYSGHSSGRNVLTLCWHSVLLVAIWTSLVVGVRAQQVTGQRPNVVILYADDMGWGDLGIQNPESKVPTPNLDQLARAGTRFTDAHSSSGICTPSRYALLNGRYHWRKFHGIVNSFDQPVMDEERLTLAELFKGAGYQTACIGKWHLGWDWNAIKRPDAQRTLADGRAYPPEAFDWERPLGGGPLDHGFDYYFGDDVPNFPPYTWFENNRVLQIPRVSLDITAKTAEGSWEARPGPAVENWDFWDVMPKLTARAVEWIGEQKADQPFFLYFPFTSPHAPIVPTPEFTGRSQANGYGDYVVQTDDTVGRVLRALDEGGFSENTLVIFTADNGPERYAYERVRKYEHRSMGHLRGLKRDIWEGGHRVPFLIRWPQHFEAGRVSDALLSRIDIFATLAALLNRPLEPGTAEDSYDQLPLWLGTGTGQRTTLVHNTNPKVYALRQAEWVLIDAPTGAISQVPQWFDTANGYQQHDQPGELYNLAVDPSQHDNRFADEPQRVEQMQAVLQELRAKGQVR